MIKEITMKEWQDFIRLHSNLPSDVFSSAFGHNRYGNKFYQNTNYLNLAYLDYDNNIVSVIGTYNISNTHVYLRGVFTLEPHRTKKLASSLILHAEKEWKFFNQFKVMFGFCESPLQSFYKKLNFVFDNELWPPKNTFNVSTNSEDSRNQYHYFSKAL